VPKLRAAKITGFAVLNTLMLNKSYKRSRGRNNTSQQILPLKLITVTMITTLFHVMTLGKLFTHTHTHTHMCLHYQTAQLSISQRAVIIYLLGRWPYVWHHRVNGTGRKSFLLVLLAVIWCFGQ